MSVAMVARKAGINRSTFYLHSKDKWELLQMCLVEWLDVFAAEPTGSTPPEISTSLPSLIRTVLDRYTARKGFFLRILE
ncbi:MAG: TetR/AcrR family transcriptional regulator [Spirochaetes bacterium]|nr:TetR/AcrR family transcriptional regulator [Spirochaetota bacterium]